MPNDGYKTRAELEAHIKGNGEDPSSRTYVSPGSVIHKGQVITSVSDLPRHTELAGTTRAGRTAALGEVLRRQEALKAEQERLASDAAALAGEGDAAAPVADAEDATTPVKITLGAVDVPAFPVPETELKKK